MIETHTLTGPAHYATAIVNDDRTGLTDREERDLDRWLAAELEDGQYIAGIVDDSERFEVFDFPDGAKAGDVIDYIVATPIKEAQ